MENENDPITAYYGYEQTYAEQLVPPSIIQPVFEQALEVQVQLADVVSELGEEHLIALKRTVGEITDGLDEMVVLGDILNEPVVLRGLSVRTPTLQSLMESARSTVQPAEPTPESDVKHMTDGVRGSFFGFGTRYELVSSPAGDGIGIRPILIYQVIVGRVATEHFSGFLLASGDVGTSSLEFLHDEQISRISESLNILLQHENPKVLKAVNNINVTLANPKAFDAQLMNYIGYQSNAVLNEIIADEQRVLYTDALIDLIETYIDWDQPFIAAAQPVLKYAALSDTNPDRRMQLTDDTPVSRFRGKFEGIADMPVYSFKGRVLKETGRRALYMAMQTPDVTWYLKLTDIKAIVPTGEN